MNWRDRFDEIRGRMLDYNASTQYMEDDDDDDDDDNRNTEMSLEDLVSIMRDACKLLRQAEEEHVEELGVIVQQVDDLTNRAIGQRFSSGAPGIRSFAHAEDALIADPWYDRMHLESKADMYKSLAAYLGLDAARVDEFIPRNAEPLEPWSSEEQPHFQTTRLSRFRPGVEFPSSTTHPRANIVFQARCEINNDLVHEPGKLVISSDGSFMAMDTRSGYKARDPVISYWNMEKESEEFAHKSFTPPFAHLVVDHVLDESRRLLFVADYDRVKSYTYGSKRRATHTLDATTAYTLGPLAILPNGRIARSGKGSAIVWNIDELETHYAPDSTDFRRVGEGVYTGFENSWRDEDSTQELSTGSAPHATIPYAEPELIPHVWQYHVPSGLMLVGMDPRESERCDCMAVDLEHGGKIATRFVGHGDQVEAFSLSDEDPNVFLTASADGYTRLWDVRQHLPVLTLEIERGESPCLSALFVHLDGLPAVFTGGSESEGIRFWDVRAKKLVYELSTGNNSVSSMAWDKQRLTLYAATEAEHQPGPSGRGVYRKAKKVRRDQQATEEDTETDDGSIDEDGVEFYDTLRWPHSAFHTEDYFGEIYDAGGKIIFRYAFKDDVNMELIPPYGQGTMGGFF